MNKPSIYIKDYITREEYRKFLENYDNYGRGVDVEYNLKNHYDNPPNEYYTLKNYIRQAIIWKSLKMDKNKFHSNGDTMHYSAIWDKLPTITGLKKTGRVYSSSWGYDQTQITTAVHYGKAFGLDVLVTGAFGSSEVLLKRIPADGRFSEGCMYFTPNRYTEKEIQETNEYTAYHGR